MYDIMEIKYRCCVHHGPSSRQFSPDFVFLLLKHNHPNLIHKMP